MKITFLGGTETVTGSKYLLESGSSRILVDCGLFQGYKWLRKRNWQPLPLDVQSLDAVVLTHAHLDHSGYIPALYRQGFRKPVFTHHATAALCGILLPDSGHIQEEDARYYERHKLSKHEHPEPLYDRITAEQSLELFETVEFGEIFKVGAFTLHLQSAGHILGAGSLIVEVEGKRVGFSGDVGKPNDVMMKPPKPLPELDVLLIPSFAVAQDEIQGRGCQLPEHFEVVKHRSFYGLPDRFRTTTSLARQASQPNGNKVNGAVVKNDKKRTCLLAHPFFYRTIKLTLSDYWVSKSEPAAQS